MGMRDVLEGMNQNYVTGEKKLVNVYIPKEVWEERMKQRFDWMLNFYQEKGIIKLYLIESSVGIKDYQIRPVKISVSGNPVYLYIIEAKNKKMVIAPCDSKFGQLPTNDVSGADLFIVDAPIRVGSIVQGVKIGKDHPLAKCILPLPWQY